jgi:hypothetical protein
MAAVMDGLFYPRLCEKAIKKAVLERLPCALAVRIF